MNNSLAALAVCAAAGLSLPACAKKSASPTTRPATAQERQDRALKDPFGYKPDWSDTDVSGGGDADLSKDGFQRDLGHVIMP